MIECLTCPRLTWYDLLVMELAIYYRLVLLAMSSSSQPAVEGPGVELRCYQRVRTMQDKHCP